MGLPRLLRQELVLGPRAGPRTQPSRRELEHWGAPPLDLNSGLDCRVVSSSPALGLEPTQKQGGEGAGGGWPHTEGGGHSVGGGGPQSGGVRSPRKWGEASTGRGAPDALSVPQ